MFGNQRPNGWPESRTTMLYKSLDVSRLQGKGDEFMEDRRSLRITAGSPHWHPTIQCLHPPQDVAGLWLKYGVKSLKIETSSLCKIPLLDATIC